MEKQEPTSSPSSIIYLIRPIISSVGVLLRVALFTLIERKVIGLAHFRKGPNKVILSGISQPISDAAKLLTKENTKFSPSLLIIIIAGPTLRIFIMFFCWGNYFPMFTSRRANLKLFIILAIIRLSAFPFILCRWGSNTKYALIGGNRAVSQVISYEVCLILFLLILFYVLKSYDLHSLREIQSSLPLSIWIPPLFLIWLIVCIAESNRTPFDLAEGESEIVSGFNIDYRGGLFALIFIREYGIIIFLSFLTALLFLGAPILLAKTFIICFLFVWVRCSFPRVRYDTLIITSWKISLPWRLSLLCLGLIFQ